MISRSKREWRNLAVHIVLGSVDADLNVTYPKEHAHKQFHHIVIVGHHTGGTMRVKLKDYSIATWCDLIADDMLPDPTNLIRGERGATLVIAI